MRHSLKGFSYFEVILYLALFSLLATTLLTFSWDVLNLTDSEDTRGIVLSDARFVSEKLNELLRNAAGIEDTSSIFDENTGKIVLLQPNSSDTITIELSSGQVLFTESGSSATPLNSSDSQVSTLRFEKYGSSENHSEYIGYTLTVDTPQIDTQTPARYQASTTLQSGAFIRNSGI